MFQLLKARPRPQKVNHRVPGKLFHSCSSHLDAHLSCIAWNCLLVFSEDKDLLATVAELKYAHHRLKEQNSSLLRSVAQCEDTNLQLSVEITELRAKLARWRMNTPWSLLPFNKLLLAGKDAWSGQGWPVIYYSIMIKYTFKRTE